MSEETAAAPAAEPQPPQAEAKPAKPPAKPKAGAKPPAKPKAGAKPPEKPEKPEAPKKPANRTEAKSEAAAAAGAAKKGSAGAKAAAKLPGGRTPDRSLMATYAQAASDFKMIGEVVRCAILHNLLAAGRMNVGSICMVVGQSQPATSHHLMLLKTGGYVQSERDGKFSFYALTDKGRDMADFVAKRAKPAA